MNGIERDIEDCERLMDFAEPVFVLAVVEPLGILAYHDGELAWDRPIGEAMAFRRYEDAFRAAVALVEAGAAERVKLMQLNEAASNRLSVLRLRLKLMEMEAVSDT